MPSKLLSCIDFLYKVVHKIGCVSVFVFTIFFSFQLSNSYSVGLEIWHSSSEVFSLQNLVCDFDMFFRSIVIRRFVPKRAKFDIQACFFL